MANQKHLDLLALGVELWNQWRREEFATTPDLRGVDLSHADLSGGVLIMVSGKDSFLRQPYEAVLSEISFILVR